MISAWTKHITDPSEKERFQNTILGSKSVLQRLQVLMNEMKEDVDTQELSMKNL
jgi:hypothetical protein